MTICFHLVVVLLKCIRLIMLTLNYIIVRHGRLARHRLVRHRRQEINVADEVGKP